MQGPAAAVPAFIALCAALSCCNATGPVTASVLRCLPAEAQAGGLALWNSLANVGGYFGPALYGWLKEETGSNAPGMVVRPPWDHDPPWAPLLSSPLTSSSHQGAPTLYFPAALFAWHLVIVAETISCKFTNGMAACVSCCGHLTMHDKYPITSNPGCRCS